MGDTTLTKVFVGGLAWETPKEAMREHFDKYGDILEAVIISDKLTGRSKGYGFVTFKDAESAKRACEDANHIINGRRANCNLASLGARRCRTPLPITPSPPQQGANVVGTRANSASPTSHVQWYYPARAPQAASPFQHHQPLPFYGYSPAYVATDMNYNHKLSYMDGHFSQIYPSQSMMGGNTFIPMYPYYHFHHHSQIIGLPAHMYSATPAGPMAAVPALMSKPTSVPPTAVCLAVE
ncbi:unnamed protein product [Withania somnifera]